MNKPNQIRVYNLYENNYQKANKDEKYLKISIPEQDMEIVYLSQLRFPDNEIEFYKIIIYKYGMHVKSFNINDILDLKFLDFNCFINKRPYFFKKSIF